MMSPNKRIFFNVVATYGRSLFSLICGLFTARWVLNALGSEDYGLFGVVGSLVVFVSFINSIFSTATTRFYAVTIGKALSARDKDKSIDECRQWFNVSLAIHTVFPLILIVVGYPIGVWLIRNFLTIPIEKVQTCVWVFRFSCLTCLIGMINVPFQAMYRAKQLIAELTIYSYATTVLNVAMFYYMVTHPRVWLLGYAVWMSMITIIPYIIIGVRAVVIFPECRVRRTYLWSPERIKKMASFAGWELIGEVCALLEGNGISILINKSFGPIINAAKSLGSSVDAHTASLASSLTGAFQPAIVNAYGEGDLDKMMRFALRTCKFGGLLQLIFVVPLFAELDQILTLWLKTPPDFTGFFCVVAVLAHMANVISGGCYTVFSACGKIKEYQLNVSKISIMALPTAMLVLWINGGIYGLGAVLVGVAIARAVCRAYYAHKIIDFPANTWVIHVVIPIVVIMLVSLVVAYIPHLLLNASIFRICLSVAVSEMALLPMVWFWGFSVEERNYLVSNFKFRFAFK